LSLPALLAARATSDADRVFMDAIGGESLTFAELHARVQRWAGALRDLGVEAGTNVVTMLPNSIDAVTTWAAISYLGAHEVPVNTEYRGSILDYLVRNSQATLVITNEYYADHFHGTDIPLVLTSADVFRAAAPVTEPPASAMRGLAAIIYTSGTTGPAKGVMVTWGQMHSTMTGTLPLADFGADDVFYAPFPAYHISGKGFVYLAALLGARIVLREAFSLSEFWADIRGYGCTTTAMVGAMANFLEGQPPQPDDATVPLRNVLMAPLLPGLDGFKERFGVRICTAYNMTELSVVFVSDGWSADNPASCGRLRSGYPGYEARLVDEDDDEVELGTPGELIVRTSVPWTLNAGYFDMPEATANAWRNGWFHTGDMFRADADGYYYFVDRNKDAIRRRGENVSSFEVEALVVGHDAVAEAAAVAVPSEYAEDEVMVFVVLAPDAVIIEKQLVVDLVDRMPRHMVPRYVEIVSELPKTDATQRVQKVKLRERGVGPRTFDREAAGITLRRNRDA
jgi:crotonobetaine/carnitine-CoA ligase